MNDWTLDESCEAVLSVLDCGKVCPHELMETMVPSMWLNSFVDSGLISQNDIRFAIIDLLDRGILVLDWDCELSKAK